ncbi:MAG TPA: Gldg family protein, partial [Planctomycetota bacterium]
MRARPALALFVLLALVATGLGTRVARRLERGGAARLELGRVRPTALSERTLARFAALEERVLVTYYVSPPARMPAGMRRMQADVTDLLEALRARFPERFDFHVVDPEARPDLAGFAARRRVAPFRVRSVTRDAWDERTVWSTLALACGSRPEALLAGLGPEHLPHLQELLVGWLDQLAAPRAARIALAAPEGFEELADELALRGSLERVDLDAGAAPPPADVLLWLRPRRVTGDQLRALEHALEGGTSVIVAGGTFDVHEEVRAEVPYVAFAPGAPAFGELAAHFGLRAERALVLDTRAEELEFGPDPGAERVLAPHWVRCIAPQQDFHRYPSQPNGTLLFRAASPLLPEPARLAELGWTAEVLGTSSDETWLASEPPRAPIELAELVRVPEAAAPKQALMVALRPDHPWHGELVFL